MPLQINPEAKTNNQIKKKHTMSGSHGTYESYTYSSSSTYTNINGKEEGKTYTTEKLDKDGNVQQVSVEEHLKPNGEVEVKETTNDGKTNQYTLLPDPDAKPKELNH